MKLGQEKFFQEAYWFYHLFVMIILFLFAGTTGLLFYYNESAGTVMIATNVKYIKVILEMLFIPWLIGCAVFIGRFLWIEYSCIKDRQEYGVRDAFKEMRARELALDMRLRRAPRVLVSEKFPCPHICSGWTPVICLPKKNYSEKQLDGIIVHELSHYQRGDIWFRRMAVVLQCVFWFHPVIRRLLDNLNYWDEAYCDYQVGMSSYINRKSYAETIIELAEDVMVPSAGNWMKPEFSIEGGEIRLKERVEMALNRRNVSRIKKSVIVALAFAVTVVGTSISVLAGIGINEFNTWTMMNAEGEVEEYVPLTYVEYEAPAGTLDVGVEIMADASPNGERDGSIYAFLKNAMWQSGEFYARSGEAINVSIVSAVPADVVVNVGIVEPDGTQRWINGSGMIAHSFQLDQTGIYKVFVRNKNMISVTVSGMYVTVTTE